MSPLRWLALGSVSAAVIAALVLGPGGFKDVGGVSTSGTAAADASVDASFVDSSLDTGAATDPPSEATQPTEASSTEPEPVPAVESAPANDGSLDTASSSPTATTTPAAPVATPTATVQPAPANADVRLRIPALNVDAAVTTLGFDGAGGFAVPTTAGGVGWYEFSAYPGAAGNAVLGGHLNWRGDRGVFDRLDELSAGDMIYVDTAAGQVAYQVVGSQSVTAQTPFADILGERSGPSTLTLFTCGGTFSTVAGAYDRRTVVNAVRV